MPLYYECPSCGFFHPKNGSTKPCDDDTQRFEPEQLDELHPEGWEESGLDNPNLIRIQALTEGIDLHGKPLVIGTRVRICAFTFYDTETDRLDGLEGNRTYLEGRLETIGEIDGLRKYTIRVETATDIRGNQPKEVKYSETFYVRVNGSDSGLGWPMFATFRVI